VTQFLRKCCPPVVAGYVCRAIQQRTNSIKDDNRMTLLAFAFVPPDTPMYLYEGRQRGGEKRVGGRVEGKHGVLRATTFFFFVFFRVKPKVRVKRASRKILGAPEW